MAMQITNIRGWVLGLVVVAGGGCRDTIENPDHCWVAEGDRTCKDLFGGGFCSNDVADCEGYQVPYGCVFEKPVSDACYSPTGNNASCAGPDPAPECTEVAGESGESGMSESSESSSESETSASPMCGDGAVDADEECDDSNEEDTDECTNECTLPVCGDGIVSPGEEEVCDPNAPSGGLCTEDCLLAGTVIWEFYYDMTEDKDVGYEVELDLQGNVDVLVSLDDDYRVLQFKETGALNWNASAGPLTWPIPQTSLAVGVDGQVIVGGVTDNSNQGHARQIANDGSLKWSHNIMNPNSGVLAVDVGALGNVVIAGYYDNMSAILFEHDEMGGAWGTHDYPDKFGPIAIGGDGNIRVWQNTGRLMLFGSTGTYLTSSDIVPDAGQGRAIDVDSGGNVFVLTQSDTDGYIIHKFDSRAVKKFSEVQDIGGVNEGADGIAVLPNGGFIVAGYRDKSPGEQRGTVSWFSPDGQQVWNIIIEEEAGNLFAQLYDVAVSPHGYAVAVGSRRVGGASTALWIRKFAI